MAALVTLDAAKVFCKVTDARQFDELQDFVDRGSDSIRVYLQSRFDETWDETTTPPRIQHAVLLWVAYFWEHRGDDPPSRDNRDVEKGVWAEIDPILAFDRTPVLR